MEASPQQSTISGDCRAGISIALGMQPLQSWHHNALHLMNGVEHHQHILTLMDFNNDPLLQININENK